MDKKTLAPPSWLKISSYQGRGYASSTILALTFLKSTTNLGLLFRHIINAGDAAGDSWLSGTFSTLPSAASRFKISSAAFRSL